ncbi:MAG: hypothetical protein ABI566_01695 [Pseudolysinimonas sp.]
MPDRFSTGAVVSIAVVAGLVAGCVIGGVGTAIVSATHQSGPTGATGPYAPPSYPQPTDVPEFIPATGDYSDLAVGEPGSPIAVAPLDCAGPCFDVTSAEAAIMPDETFADWNLPTFKHVWKMTGDRGIASDLLADSWETWDASGFTPDECFVTANDQPIAEARSTVVADDFVAPLTENSTSLYAVSRVVQSVRLFPDTASAEAYMATVAAGVSSCVRYENASGYGWDVSPEPGLHPPASIAAVGFVKSPEPGTRYYVFDMQRGNLVIRSVGVSDGGLDDTTFRTLMQQQLVALDLVPRVR